MNIHKTVEIGINNSYRILTGESTLDEIIAEASIQEGELTIDSDPIFFINPEEDYDGEDLDTMIEFFETREEYEKCGALLKIKK